MLFKSLHGLNAKAEHDAVAAAHAAADKSSVNGTSTSPQGAVTRNGFSLQTFWPIGRYVVASCHLYIYQCAIMLLLSSHQCLSINRDLQAQSITDSTVVIAMPLLLCTR
jgi:hypothetical protein